jgi:hypothetical protein
MTPEEAWEANFQGVQAAKQELRDAVTHLAGVEREVARACNRQRFPNAGERGRLDAARARLDQAREDHEAAKVRFKAGVTPEQLED